MKKNSLITSLLLFLIILLGFIIRIFIITSVPPTLHGDELGIAYNAFTLLKTGKDELGKYLPIIFRNDFTPLIFYLTIPFIYSLGLNEVSARLPTILFSVLTLPVIYLFVLQLLNKRKLALLTTFLVAVSSWDIRIARIGVGITLPLFFQLLGTYLFVKSLRLYKILRVKYLIFSFALFSLSLYSYQSAKITTPLLILSLFFIFRSKFKIRRYLFLFLILFLLFIILPTVQYLLSLPLEKMRFSGISVFTLWRSTLNNKTNILSYFSPVPLLNLVTMIVHNYFIQFSPRILFIDNRLLRYHQLPSVGLFYLWQAPFIIIGLFYLLKKVKLDRVKLIFSWLLISPIAAAFTTGVPYANVSRSLMMLPIIELFCAYGIISALYLFNKLHVANVKYFFNAILIGSFLASFVFFNRQYFIKTPKDYSDFWGLPLKETALTVLRLENQFDKVVITNKLSPQTYMYILFYGKKDPNWLFNTKRKEADIIGYQLFGKYEIRQINWFIDKDLPNTIIIGTSAEIPKNNNLVKEIQLHNNDSVRIIKTHPN